jgi:hypothetical protein
MSKDMHQFADALASKDVNRYSEWFADDMKLYTPVREEPSVGKQTACQILSMVFSLFGNFHYPDVFTGQRTHALIFRAEVKDIPLEGVDYVRTDENGRVTEFSVTMRPLKAINTLSKEIGAIMRQSQGNDSAPPQRGDQ